MGTPLTRWPLWMSAPPRRAENPESLAKLSQTDGERKRISNLLKDFMEFAELRPPRGEAIDLREVIQSAVGVTRPLLNPHTEVRVTVGTASARITGDAVQTHKAISSVLHRAFDVTEVGSVTVRLQRERNG